ncbi:MAG: DUF1697 domain-containing protein [Gemmatimonadales bacterium]
MTPEPPPRSNPARRVALLRGINVGGKHRVPMAELRQAAEALGWTDVQSYIQSGNLVFAAAGQAAAFERTLEAAIAKRFGLAIPAMVRTAREWLGYLGKNPFPDASASEPGLVMLALSKAPLAAGAAAALQGRAMDGERVQESGGALWIYFPGGSGRSKLSPALMDRLAGSPVTMRNWRTVVKLGELLGC